MSYKLPTALFTMLIVCAPALAQNVWSWSHRFELRANYRWSQAERHPNPFIFPPDHIPPGQDRVFFETPDEGHRVELNVADVQLDAGYGDYFAARAKAHVQAKHRRNPTSSDRKIDVDELYVRFGPKPEVLDRPRGTTFFAQVGKFPKMERQPTRMLESYGLAATTFNRFEDLQLLVGGTVGRNLYWRAQVANGNPLFFRDPNALAGDNGAPDRHPPNPNPDIKSGFPILYNAETEDLFFDTDNVQIGEALGYRWQREDQTLGFDVILFHYRRDLADTVELTGTFYGGDLDLLNGPFDLGGLPLKNETKREYGSRIYAEWRNLTAIGQFTKQNLAGLQREAWEAEVGYRFPLRIGPLESIQPAVRVSGIKNRFTGNGRLFPAASIWWPWKKYDAGVRVGLRHGLDVTLEYTDHSVTSVQKLNLREALVTVRWRS